MPHSRCAGVPANRFATSGPLEEDGRMRRLRVVVLVALVAVGMLGVAGGIQALGDVTVPTTAGQAVTVTWQGTTLPGANPGSDCSGTALGADSHAISIAVPAGAYTG